MRRRRRKKEEKEEEEKIVNGKEEDESAQGSNAPPGDLCTQKHSGLKYKARPNQKLELVVAQFALGGGRVGAQCVCALHDDTKPRALLAFHASRLIVVSPGPGRCGPSNLRGRKQRSTEQEECLE
ncbi:hypothetical protein ElyMa_004604300 [Elysia marginata]|uniref:Uncharacterized protein n=1 Tax=Elysia marginata TaxID=1093978 RepID=A0AAV4HVT5_9GAST|nr:hypothetical protein ElyMa_004604300 [Elysia marginata]